MRELELPSCKRIRLSVKVVFDMIATTRWMVHSQRNASVAQMTVIVMSPAVVHNAVI